MRIKTTKALLLILIFLISLSFTQISITFAKSKTVSSLKLFNSISNEDFFDKSNKEQVNFLIKEIRKKDRMLNTLTKQFKNKIEIDKIEDLFDQFTLNILKENINDKINKIIKYEKIKPEIDEKLDISNVVEGDFENTDKTLAFASFEKDFGENFSFASIEEQIQTKIDQYIYEKNNINNINLLYKISHNPKTIFVINKARNYENNIDLIAKRWAKGNENNSYYQISQSLDEYQTDYEILNYLKCVNFSNRLCNDFIGKEKLVERVDYFIKTTIEEKRISDILAREEEAKKIYSKKTKKLHVTSYNPECHQTKGGVMNQETGECYATTKYPCAIGSNKGKTEGLCGNPFIAATGENMFDLLQSGVKPIAVTQNLARLKGKTVYLKCYDKKGEEVFDERCNGTFKVVDYKHERFADSVDLFFVERKDNIGSVNVEIYYETE